MAKKYDPILCMMVDKSAKAQDEILFYQLRFSSGRTEGAKLDESEIRSYAEALLEKYGEKQVAVSRQGKIVATYLNAKAKDESEKYAVIMKNSSGKEQYTQGWDLGSIRNWIKDNEKRGYRVTWKNFDSKTIDKAIKTCDAVDIDRISNYLWIWAEGREVASLLFNEGLDKYPGPHDKEHKDEAYSFAKKYAQKELDAVYSKLKSSVEKKLKEGYTNVKNTINSAK